MSAGFRKLYRAIMSDNQMVYAELRNSNTNVDILFKETVKHSEDTLLHVAAYWKRHHIAEIIINLKPSLLLETNAKGESPLHVAASAGSEEVTRLIIDRLHQIEVENGKTILRMKSKNEEETALHKAVRNGHIEVVKLLIREDPELTKLVNKYGDSPLFMAVNTRQLQIARIILTVSDCFCKGRKDMNALHAAIVHQSREIASCLIETREAELVEQKDEDFGWTPLHYAANMNDTQTIQMLLSAENSDASIKDNNGMTALHIAAKRGHIRAVEKLVEICPEICGIVDDKGQSFFHIAVKSGRFRVVRFALGKPYPLFLDYLAYVTFWGVLQVPVNYLRGLHRQLFADEFLNMQDYQGNTALHLAALNKDYFTLSLMTTDRRLSRATNNDGLAVSDGLLSPVISSNLMQSFLSLLTTGGKPGIMQPSEGSQINTSSSVISSSLMQSLLSLLITGGKPGIMQPSERRQVKKSEDEAGKSWDLRQINLLISTLIATVSFTAALSVPGGFKIDGPDEGTAALSHKSHFRAFIISNAIAFCLSVTTILISRYNPAMKSFFDRFTIVISQMATLAMLVAFIFGTFAVLGPSEAKLALNVIYVLVACFPLMYVAAVSVATYEIITESADELEE